ncbi:uncharacterized protein LOC134688359 [Mytilus trossulus]|uniref:uncharacterized protein LOC134688359 n=1 Tax=Mytilus trossulus TaxID=6551 RepID=UPI003004AD59
MCAVDDGICSRFLYKDMQCMLHTDEPAISSTNIQTTDNWSLFFTKHKECDLLGYDYDIYSRTCLKFNSTQLTWYDARQQCIGEGGDLITVDTVGKLNFHNTSLNNCSTSQFYWIGLINGIWTSGELFQDIYGLGPTDIRINPSFPGICGRLRFSPGTANLMYDTNCDYVKEFVCELNISV